MADPSHRVEGRRFPFASGGIRALACGLVAGVVVACSLVPGGQGDQSAPILVTGRVLGANGAPLGGASLDLQVFDDANAQIGQPVPLVIHETYTASADGTFAIRYAPTPKLRTFALANGGWVNFHLMVLEPERGVLMPWGFSRELSPTGWLGEPPTVTIGPNGVEQPRSEPGVPAHLPAAT